MSRHVPCVHICAFKPGAHSVLLWIFRVVQKDSEEKGQAGKSNWLSDWLIPNESIVYISREENECTDVSFLSSNENQTYCIEASLGKITSCFAFNCFISHSSRLLSIPFKSKLNFYSSSRLSNRLFSSCPKWFIGPSFLFVLWALMTFVNH